MDVDDIIIRIWAFTGLVSFAIISTFMINKVLAWVLALLLVITSIKKVFLKYNPPTTNDKAFKEFIRERSKKKR